MKNMKNKLRVCLIVRYSKIAGTENHVYLLATHLNSDFIEPHVLILEDGELGRRLRNKGITVTVIPNSKSVMHYLRLILFFARKKFDIVHCHSGGYVCLAAKLAGVKRIVYTKHGIGATKEELKCRFFDRKLRDVLINLCVIRYIALTEYDKYVMVSVLHISKNIIQIIHNGIDPTISSVSLGRKKTCPIVGIVGRLEKQKGISYLIEAIPKIAEKYSNIKLLIAGSGEEETALKNLAKSLRISEKITFLGYVNDPLSVINQMDVFVLPSVWEGFPYVLLEAMLLKKPIVATDIFGIQEIISNNKNGILVKPKSPDSIAKAIIELLTDKKKAKKLGEAAYKKVIKHYTLEGTVSKIQTLYSHLLENQ